MGPKRPDLRRRAGRAAGTLWATLWAALWLAGAAWAGTPAPLPDGGVAEAMGVRAWYAAPTDRYRHGVLGDAVEAGSLIVDSGGLTTRYDLPATAVFEDITPRIVDADGDGTPEILTILAYRDAGAAPALFGLRDGRLVRLAEGAAIGVPNRWLNPAGVADYDGDGTPEIAVIRTPHIGGILILYRWEEAAGRLVEERRLRGFSTHAIGSRALGLALTLDWNGDGTPDLLLPRQNRRELVALSMAGGTFEELAAFDMRREIAGDLERLGNFVKIPLEDGLVRTLTVPYGPKGKDG
jgi:hypothetical protein